VHAVAALLLGKEPPLFIRQELGPRATFNILKRVLSLSLEIEPHSNSLCKYTDMSGVQIYELVTHETSRQNLSSALFYAECDYRHCVWYTCRRFSC
jgi:hypothetical protein